MSASKEEGIRIILLAGSPQKARFVNKKTIFPMYRYFESPCILIERIEDEEKDAGS